MTVKDLAERLEINLAVFEAMLEDVDSDQATWKPDQETWSVIEIVNHLADEEAEDFRAAAEMLIFTPNAPWPDAAPLKWIAERDYASRSFEDSLDRWLAERERSITWLNELPEPDWDSPHEGSHPFDQAMRLGDLLSSWLAHDYYHIRQLNRVKWLYLDSTIQPYRTLYAGGNPGDPPD